MDGKILAGRYLVGETLGSGGMGAVYRATDLRTGGLVAIKIPHPWLTVDANYVARLHREAQIAASLSSPRVVKVIDFDWHEGRPFLVMEYVPGQTLADILAERGALSWQAAVRIALEVSRALLAAQQGGIVHRDLKPQNIKIVDDDVKVLDFGIARAASLPAVTAADVVVGTPLYMAPERLDGPSDAAAVGAVAPGDVRSDIYAVGVIMYEMLTGRPPFTGATYWAILSAHLNVPPPPLPNSVPAPVRQIVFRCLEKQPADRFQTPAQLATALRALPAAEPVEPERDASIEPAASEARAATSARTRAPEPRAVEPTAARPSNEITLPRPAPPAASAETTDNAATLMAPSLDGRSLGGGRAPKRHSLIAPLPVLSGLCLAVLLGAGVVIAAGRGGSVNSPATELDEPGIPTATAETEALIPTPVPTAAPVRVADLKIFRSGGEFLAGAAPVDELTVGDDIFVCYGFHGAGNGTSLSVVAAGPDGAPNQLAASEPFSPASDEDVRCESVPGAREFVAGRYAIGVHDRDDERARQDLTISAPPPPGPPTPVPVQQSVPQRQPTAVRPVEGAQQPTVGRTPAPAPFSPATAQPAPSTAAPPAPPPTQAPATPPVTPPPGRTAVPGQ